MYPSVMMTRSGELAGEKQNVICQSCTSN